jgi:hypothetical protein
MAPGRGRVELASKHNVILIVDDRAIDQRAANQVHTATVCCRHRIVADCAIFHQAAAI